MDEQTAVIDRTMSPVFVNVAGTALTLVIVFAVLALYSLARRSNPLAVFNSSATLEVLLIALAVFFISIVVHELLHGLGYRLGGAPRNAVRFGFQWKALLPYSHCTVPLRASAYRFAVALPGLVLGLLPAALGILLGSDMLALYGAGMLAGAAGDIMTLALLLPLKSDAQVQDHPSKPGFQILL
jgi:uncharacterized membrane protein YjgN (DUF898 family)